MGSTVGLTVEDGQGVTGDPLAALEVRVDLSRVGGSATGGTWHPDDTSVVAAAAVHLAP
jgi:hypothetical protein